MAVINYFAGLGGTAIFSALPVGVVPNVQLFEPNGGHNDDPEVLLQNVNALFHNFSRSLHSFAATTAVSATIVFHGRRISILRFVGLVGNSYESEFHCVDTRVVEFNDGNVAMQA
jgi:hypothetical protein